MGGGSGCGEGCLVWARALFFLSIHWQSPRVLKECAVVSFPRGESKGTALGLVRCQSRGHLPTREASWIAVEAGGAFISPGLLGQVLSQEPLLNSEEKGRGELTWFPM